MKTERIEPSYLFWYTDFFVLPLVSYLSEHWLLAPLPDDMRPAAGKLFHLEMRRSSLSTRKMVSAPLRFWYF